MLVNHEAQQREDRIRQVARMLEDEENRVGGHLLAFAGAVFVLGLCVGVFIQRFGLLEALQLFFSLPSWVVPTALLVIASVAAIGVMLTRVDLQLANRSQIHSWVFHNVKHYPDAPLKADEVLDRHRDLDHAVQYEQMLTRARGRPFAAAEQRLREAIDSTFSAVSQAAIDHDESASWVHLQHEGAVLMAWRFRALNRGLVGAPVSVEAVVDPQGEARWTERVVYRTPSYALRAVHEQFTRVVSRLGSAASQVAGTRESALGCF